ncbi:hypothetical protein L3Q82_017180, partial [Scortum barcoo]
GDSSSSQTDISKSPITSPGVFPTCVVTRAMRAAGESNPDKSEDKRISVFPVPVFPLFVTRSELVKQQKNDPTLRALYNHILPEDEVESAPRGYFLRMICWKKSTQLCHVNLLKPYYARSYNSDSAHSLATVAIAAPVDPPSPAPCLTADSEERDKTKRTHKSNQKLSLVYLQIPLLVPISLSMILMWEMPSPFDNTSIACLLTGARYLEAEVRYMLKNNIAEPCASSWSSPCLLVSKPDGTFRPCTELRKVNKITKPDVLSTSPHGGLCGPATFQRLMNKVVSGLEGCAVYLDDVVIYSDSWHDHLQRIKALFERLAWAALTINLAKCDFAKATVTYLGKVVGQGQVRPVRAKVLAIDQFPVPTTKKELSRFLGMAGYYRGFCKDFSTVAAPLTSLLSSKAKFVWSPVSQHAFEGIKSLLCSAPVLAAPKVDLTLHS